MVLQLTETSFNRRYIAHIRRGRTYRQVGQISDALKDVEAILMSDDIVQEQKMQARLFRASILIERSDHAEAVNDLDIVLQAAVNFSGAIPQAHFQRGVCNVELGKTEAAIQDFSAVIARPDAKSETITESHLRLGHILTSQNKEPEAQVEFKKALSFIQKASNHPATSDEVRLLKKVIASLDSQVGQTPA